MIVIVQKKKSCDKLVQGSVETTVVGVQLTPQSQPFELSFTDVQDAMALVHRLHQPDGEQFAVSIQSYMNATEK